MDFNTFICLKCGVTSLLFFGVLQTGLIGAFDMRTSGILAITVYVLQLFSDFITVQYLM